MQGGQPARPDGGLDLTLLPIGALQRGVADHVGVSSQLRRQLDGLGGAVPTPGRGELLVLAGPTTDLDERTRLQ